MSKVTAKEAAAILGTTPTTVQQAIIRGLLPAAKEKRPTSCGLRTTYVIDVTDIEAYRSYRACAVPQRRWTVDMDAAAVELVATCTYAQIGAYLGVSAGSVKARLQKLGATPSERHSKNPFVIPKSAVPVAMTCTICGELRSASAFYKAVGRRKQRASECVRCTSNAKKRRRDHLKRSGHVDLSRKLQAHTEERATNHREEWTASDDAVLEDATKSTYQVALDLGRTLYSVHHRRRSLGITKRAPVHAVDRWEIELLATQAEIEAYFRSLGPVPESDWEWSDGDTAAAS